MTRAWVLLIASYLGQGDTSAPPGDVIPQPGAVLEPGEEACILRGMPTTSSSQVLHDLMESVEAKDAIGLQAMTDNGKIGWTESLVKVLILERPNGEILNTFKVRVLDGPQKGSILYSPMGAVFRMVPAPKAIMTPSRDSRARKGSKRKPEFVKPEPVNKDIGKFSADYIKSLADLDISLRTALESLAGKINKPPLPAQPKTAAVRLLDLARACAAEGDSKSAAEIYNIIVREYKGSPQAELALAELRR